MKIVLFFFATFHSTALASKQHEHRLVLKFPHVYEIRRDTHERLCCTRPNKFMLELDVLVEKKGESFEMCMQCGTYVI